MLASLHFTVPNLFAAGCVAIFAWERFSRPPWRAMTPRLQWMAAVLGYVLSAVGAWLVMTSIISNQPETLSAFFGFPPEAARAMAELSAPFAAALALTVLLPNAPVLKRVDWWLQMRFRELGAIPQAARTLASRMKRADFELPASIAPTVRMRLEGQGLDPDAVLAAPQGTPMNRWVKIVTVMAHLEDDIDVPVPNDPEAPAQAQDAVPALLRDLEILYGQSSARYRRLSGMAAMALAPEPGDGQGANGLLRTFDDETDELFRGLCALVACALLRKSYRTRMAVAELRGWGFRVEEEAARALIRGGDVLGLTVLIFVYFMVMVQVLGIGDGQIVRATYMSAFIAVTLAAAASCVGIARLLLRRYRDPARRFAFGQYLLAAALAGVCWCGLFYVRLAVFEAASVADALEQLRVKWPFMLHSAAAAFAVGLLVDADIRRLGLPGLAARAVEAFAVAAVLTGVAWYVAGLLAQIAPPGSSVPPAENMMRLSFGMGFIVGFFVPDLYRKASELDRSAAPDANEREFAATWGGFLPDRLAQRHASPDLR